MALHPTEAAFYGAEILVALKRLHAIDIFVKDLNAEEVLLDDDGHVKLYSFGLHFYKPFTQGQVPNYQPDDVRREGKRRKGRLPCCVCVCVCVVLCAARYAVCGVVRAVLCTVRVADASLDIYFPLSFSLSFFLLRYSTSHRSRPPRLTTASAWSKPHLTTGRSAC